LCAIAVRIIGVQQFHGFFVDVRKLGTNQTSGHPYVNAVFRQFKRVRGPVMAVSAVHNPLFPFFEFLLADRNVRRDIQASFYTPESMLSNCLLPKLIHLRLSKLRPQPRDL
jgi:hypothetical protein